MPDKKISVTWDDLKSRKVDTRLKEQQAMARNRAYAKLDAESVPQVTGPSRSSILYNSIFYMTAFGLVGGLLAWTCGLGLQFSPSMQAEAASLIGEMQRVTAARDTGQSTAAQAEDALAMIRADGRGNPYFDVQTDPDLSDSDRDSRLAALASRDRSKQLIAGALAYGVCGLMIATCLAVAEPLTQRNFPSTLVNGSVAALLGLVGGLAAALFVDGLHTLAGGAAHPSGLRAALAQSVTWGVLGIFLSVGAGVVMRNRKKLLIGIAGGLVGGLIGGALFEPARLLTHSPQIGRLVALLAIGAVSGIGTGLIENATRSGWLRVIAGVLAGKQFVLYRNPTFIGSAPDCQIYLFKDAKVGPRHAAIHIVPGAFELEDLPLGSKTTINGKPVAKARLRHGDRVTVGATSFLFQERERAG
jgi:hypothetical protein